jgi:sialate O-acetylesterase
MRLIALALGLLVALDAAAGGALLHPLFQDHAVLQRDRAVRIWGTAEPAAAVTVSIAAATVTVRAGADGAWQASLPAMSAGGPHELTVRSSGGTTQTIHDVLIGDVWLCSGQSNMEMPVRRVTNSDTEIADSANDQIRLLTVQRASSEAPLLTFAEPVAWSVASPDVVDDFSAACYFFGRDLHKANAVPQGLIHSSWGGSIIQAWISAAGLHELGNYDEELKLLALHAQSPQQADERWRAALEKWWREHDPAARHAVPWGAFAFDDTDWPTATPAGFWEKSGIPALQDFDGIVWYRKTVTLSAQQAQGKAVLALGPIDDVDVTWVNGTRVGGTEGWDTQRVYAIPPGVLRAGKNVIAVGALDSGGGGGMWGPPQQRSLRLESGPIIPLDGDWRYRISGALAEIGSAPRTPWLKASGVTTLYNGMIAPLAGYTLRGAAWYQGESNVTEAPEYARLLPALMQDWRRAFGAELPFLVVQLAGFGPAASAPMDSAWASLREVQRRVVDADDAAALAVTIDIGDRYDIHPTNKQEVGRRLALAARRVVFGDSLISPGPTPIAARRVGDEIVIDFANAAQGLVVYGATRPVGFELCDRQKECRFVDATVERDRVVLNVGDVSDAASVRYGWANSPPCNLYDRNDLPVVPFEMAIGL